MALELESCFELLSSLAIISSASLAKIFFTFSLFAGPYARDCKVASISALLESIYLTNLLSSLSKVAIEVESEATWFSSGTGVSGECSSFELSDDSSGSGNFAQGEPSST